MLWFLVFVFARDFVVRIHTRWFKIAEERFDEIHYTMMGYYKRAHIHEETRTSHGFFKDVFLITFTSWLKHSVYG